MAVTRALLIIKNETNGCVNKNTKATREGENIAKVGFLLEGYGLM
jgi:hypothetical protein